MTKSHTPSKESLRSNAGSVWSTTRILEKNPDARARPEQFIAESPSQISYTAFSHSRQIFILTIVTAAGFFAPICGSIYMPSLILFEKIFRTSSTVINATVAVYMGVFAISPLFGAAASDYGGRKTVYIVCLAVFLIANTLLAVLPPNLGSLFTLRVFQAIGASMVTSIGAGTVADITTPMKRASRMGIFLLGPQLGPILGPFIGGFFSDESHWRWIFGFLSITCFPVYLLILFGLPETLRGLVGDGSVWSETSSWIVKPKLCQEQVVNSSRYPRAPPPTIKGLIKILIWVPNLIVTLIGGFNFAGLYCIYLVFPRVWQVNYGFSGNETGYAYLAPEGITLLVASVTIGRLSDMLYRRAKAKRPDTTPVPEKRLDLQVWGLLVSAAGRALFGWSIKQNYHPAVGLVASAIAGTGAGIVMVTSTAYQTECQPTAAASLVALTGMARNGGSAIAAAIIDELLKAMGYGWLFTGIAILDIICIGGLIFIRIKGHVYRAQLPPPRWPGPPHGPPRGNTRV
ncbi:MFS general substrate transporter [Corynespora cassiicola Philippines]|uniref:MFS general substrate transporter n=1 Tax=Corynespora cassiicola Philippines TaxID=1448308 RepID=A0A2T2NLY5_CORCC|nr:MFS general substrate transporter [Corynespora cassiicola Philippines]